MSKNKIPDLFENSNIDNSQLSVNPPPPNEDKVAIIVVHKDRPEFLSICLHSISITTINSNYELIVVDNGSGPDTQEWLNQLEKDSVKIVRNDKNNYWSKACNQGVRVADPACKYFVFMHCDTVVLSPAWLDILINASIQQDAGMIGLQMSAYMMGTQKYSFIEDWCVLVTRNCYQECGQFPEDLPTVGGAFYFTMAAMMKKFNPQCIKSSIVHHYKMNSLDYSEWVRMRDHAKVTIPAMIRDLQSKSNRLLAV